MKKSPLVLVLLGIALILLAIVDLRRGFLFPEGSYLYKSAFIIFSPFQLLLLITGGISLKLSPPVAVTSQKRLLSGIFFILLMDLVLYRGVAMNRSLTAGKVGLGWLDAFGETGMLKTFYLSLSYILTVWHATFLSCLIGGWGILAFPHISSSLGKSSHGKAGVMGTLFSFTQPLCSCCAALTAPSLFKMSLPKSFAISVLIGAPLLNLSTLTLAGTLLPWPFFLIRLIGGILVTLVLGIAVSKFIAPDLREACVVDSPVNHTPSHNIVQDWMKLSGKLLVWLLPSIVLGIVLTSFIWQFWPADYTNSWSSVAVVSILGSLLMVSTWSEIPLALQFLSHGLNGPAAAALIALPAVNFASLLLIGKSTGQWKIAVSLGIAIAVISFGIGISFT